MAKTFRIAACHSINGAEKFATYVDLASPTIAKGGSSINACGVAAKTYENGRLERTTIMGLGAERNGQVL